MANKSDIFLAQLRAQAAAMLARFEQVSSFAHNLTRGLARETPLRQYLSHHLPGRIGVGTGTVVSSRDTPNAQHDIILFDRDFSAPILHDETASVFPIETVHGIVEVKSGPILDLDAVTHSLAKIRELNRLPGVRGTTKGTTPPGFHTLMSYVGPTAETALSQLERANDTNGSGSCERLPLDMVLILSTEANANIESGYLLGFRGVPSGTSVATTQYYPVRGCKPTVLCKGPDVFARWLTHLINHLNGCECFPPPLFGYFGFDYHIASGQCRAIENSTTGTQE